MDLKYNLRVLNFVIVCENGTGLTVDKFYCSVVHTANVSGYIQNFAFLDQSAEISNVGARKNSHPMVPVR